MEKRKDNVTNSAPSSQEGIKNPTERPLLGTTPVELQVEVQPEPNTGKSPNYSEADN